jgi:hypothetical protein
MEPNELELLKKVLPQGYFYQPGRKTFPTWVILDEEGEVFVESVAADARTAVMELMEASRKRGAWEGRLKAQHEVRTSLGLTEVLRDIRDEINELKSR